MMLRVEGLEVHYGQVRALTDVRLEVERGEIVAIIGANGAGKTTLLKAISGALPATRGTISFEGQGLVGLTPEQVVRRGISHVPEGRQLFGGLSVEDNLMLGSYSLGFSSWNLVAGQLRHRARKGEIARQLAEVFAIFPRLAERRRQQASTLSGGEGQMLAIGRALMSAPKLLLLDEPSLGLAPRVVDEILSLLVRLRAGGLTILLVEQNARAALEIADRGYAMELGAVRLAGPAAELLADPRVQHAYLGHGVA